MNISSYAQEMMCYVGQHLVFKEAQEVFNNFTGADVNAKQIERVCHEYGERLEEDFKDEVSQQGYAKVSNNEAKEVNYVCVDGSMLLTREEKWKEIKLGRIYKDRDRAEVSKNRVELQGSTYVSHLGSSKDFIPKMDYYIENLVYKVFIGDGASWIWNWVMDTYPDCIQIVDFFHAKEHFCEFAKTYFKDDEERTQWIDKQSLIMLNKGITPVIKTLKKLPNKTKKLKQLIGYYENHEKRMQYHIFREKGLQIGSGAIESAHKDVLQKRLKLSGQRWTKKGLQQIANLRTAYKSAQWAKVVEMTKKVA